MERDIADKSAGRRSAAAAPAGIDVDGNRPGHVLQNQIREQKILHLRTGPKLHLDRTAERFINDAVGNGDVFGIAADETEHRPARAERAVGDGDEFATAEQRAGVVLRLHVAILDVKIFATDEMKSVVVAVDAIVNVQAGHPDKLALNHADGMKRASDEKQIAHAQILAAIKQQMIRPMAAADAGGRHSATNGAVELRAIAVNRARPLDGDVHGVDGENQPDVSIFEGRVAVKRNGICGVVLFAVAAAEQFSARRDAQRHVALHFNRADDEHARRHQHRAALVFGASVNRGLHRGGIEGRPIADRAEVADVINSRAQIVRG